jgi:hypothetical protein
MVHHRRTSIMLLGDNSDMENVLSNVVTNAMFNNNDDIIHDNGTHWRQETTTTTTSSLYRPYEHRGIGKQFSSSTSNSSIAKQVTPNKPKVIICDDENDCMVGDFTTIVVTPLQPKRQQYRDNHNTDNKHLDVVP